MQPPVSGHFDEVPRVSAYGRFDCSRNFATATGVLLARATMLVAVSSSVVWCGVVWYGMVWYGMVWYGVVWYGMAFYGLAWYDCMVCMWC